MNRTPVLTPVVLMLTSLGSHADLITSAASYTSWQPSYAPDFSIWQGFDHHWQRTVLGLPINHRISALKSFIDEDDRSGTKTAVMGQGTGVDGNFMKPALYYSTVRGAGIQRWVGTAQLNWTDQIDQSAYPTAQSHMKVKVDLPAGLGSDPSRLLVAGLQGIDVSTACDNNKQPLNQPCNSDGAWPIHFKVSIADCDAGGIPLNNRSPSCFLTVDYDRAWTPGKGGAQFAPFDIGVIKPLNQRLDFAIKIQLALYWADSSSMSATREQVNTSRRRLYDAIPSQLFPIADGMAGARTSATVITGLSFTLKNLPKVSSLWNLLVYDTDHAGRYLTEMAFHAANPAAGSTQLLSRAGVWSPPNVVNSDIEASLTTRLVTFKSAGSVTPGVAFGSLCINSSPAAPWFSFWKNCNPGTIYGPEQKYTSVRIP